MKRAVFAILFTIIMALTLSSCHPTSFSLTESEIDKLYAEDTSSVNVIYPSAEEITGVYRVNGKDAYDKTVVRNAYLRIINGKYILQVIKTDISLTDPTEEEIGCVTSSYDESIGHFQQKFISNEYISSYDVCLFKKNGVINIVIQNQNIVSGHSEIVSINYEGYKTGGVETIQIATDETDTSTQEGEIN